MRKILALLCVLLLAGAAQAGTAFDLYDGYVMGGEVEMNFKISTSDTLGGFVVTLDYLEDYLTFKSVSEGANLGNLEIEVVNDDCCISYPPDSGHKRVLALVSGDGCYDYITGNNLHVLTFVFDVVDCPGSGLSNVTLPDIIQLNHAGTVVNPGPKCAGSAPVDPYQLSGGKAYCEER